jgi:hypothetical protein
VEELEIDELHGMISIDNRYVVFNISDGSVIKPIEGYRVSIAK